jgi:hypothetical protein
VRNLLQGPNHATPFCTDITLSTAVNQPTATNSPTTALRTWQRNPRKLSRCGVCQRPRPADAPDITVPEQHSRVAVEDARLRPVHKCWAKVHPDTDTPSARRASYVCPEGVARCGKVRAGSSYSKLVPFAGKRAAVLLCCCAADTLPCWLSVTCPSHTIHAHASRMHPAVHGHLARLPGNHLARRAVCATPRGRGGAAGAAAGAGRGGTARRAAAAVGARLHPPPRRPPPRRRHRKQQRRTRFR